MRILLDVMGGDLPPYELVKGGVAAGRRLGIDIVFSGAEGVIRSALSRLHERENSKLSILPSTQAIAMTEPPVQAVRKKKDSSLVNGLVALKKRTVDAFVSPGNTGAVVAGAVFIVGRIAGIPRPGIAASIPTVSGREIVVIDVGANVDCTPEHLLYFALMGATYARDVLGIADPRIGLLNIGTERAKGNKVIHRVYDLLTDGPLPFAGNVEGHHLLTERPVDVVVCDGFIGNVFLKTLEGGISAMSSMIKKGANRNLQGKLGGLMLRPVFFSLRKKLAYNRLGGAPLLGVDGSVVIAHGRSDALAIESAVDVAYRAVESRLNETMARGVSGWDSNGS
ncbi:phosphate acyltransferase PlsX [Candidatus Bipolaricaulota bacterium]|nr:phosphate acyltransferase PlsX [Candidatus Bipolaricaulota bacterium]